MLEKRYVLAILAFFTTFNVYSLRNGITVSILKMATIQVGFKVIKMPWLKIAPFSSLVHRKSSLYFENFESVLIRLIQQIKLKLFKTILSVQHQNWIRSLQMEQLLRLQNRHRRTLYGTKKTKLIYLVLISLDTGANWPCKFRSKREKAKN